MSRKLEAALTACTLIGVAIALASPARSASLDAFLKIDTIKGESRDDKHKDWIEVLSYSSGSLDMRACQGTGGPGTLTFKGVLPPGAMSARKGAAPVNAVMETAQATDGLLIVRYMGATLVPPARAGESMSLNYSKVSWTRPKCSAAKR
jgi:hypothetical protein